MRHRVRCEHERALEVLDRPDVVVPAERHASQPVFDDSIGRVKQCALARSGSAASGLFCARRISAGHTSTRHFGSRSSAPARRPKPPCQGHSGAETRGPDSRANAYPQAPERARFRSAASADCRVLRAMNSFPSSPYSKADQSRLFVCRLSIASGARDGLRSWDCTASDAFEISGSGTGRRADTPCAPVSVGFPRSGRAPGLLHPANNRTPPTIPTSGDGRRAPGRFRRVALDERVLGARDAGPPTSPRGHPAR